VTLNDLERPCILLYFAELGSFWNLLKPIQSTRLNSSQLNSTGSCKVEFNCKRIQSASKKNWKSLIFLPVAKFWTFSELVEQSWVESGALNTPKTA